MIHHQDKLLKELHTNFNKRARSIDNAIQTVAPSLNATELLVLNHLANQKVAIYLDRNVLAEKLNRSVNSISNAIISLVNLNVLVFDYDFNKKTKQKYTRKKKYFINTNTKEWQQKTKTDYRLKENRFIGSLRSVNKNEFNCNLALAIDENPRYLLTETFKERSIKAYYLNKQMPQFVKEAILQYGLAFLLEWLDQVDTAKFVEMSNEQLQNEFYQFGKAKNALVIRSQRIVYRTRHKTLADDYNELDYLQFKALIVSDKDRMDLANSYRSTLYRNSQRIHNMDISAFHTEKQTIAVRQILLNQNLVPLEDEKERNYLSKNITLDLPAVKSSWDFKRGSYPTYSGQYNPVQTYQGKTYFAGSYLFALERAELLVNSGRVRAISQKECNNYLKTEIFQTDYIEQRQFNYVPYLESLDKVRSREEFMAKGLTNIIRLWDCGAINDIDFEIGYQILVDEAQSFELHCSTAQFNPFTFIDECTLNYKQKTKLKAISRYLCLDDATVLNMLKEILSDAKLVHQGAFKQDTYFAYLDNKFTPEIARKLKEEQISGHRILHFDPFVRLSRIMEELKGNDADLEEEIKCDFNVAIISEQECDECNAALQQIYFDQEQLSPPPNYE